MALATKPTTATLIGSSGTSADYIIGSIADDIITGGVSATVIAGDGVDTMEGGAGDDSYLVNNDTDVINELANEGTDTVYTTVTYILPSEVENGAIVATTAKTLTGNTKDNKLDGTQNNVADTLIGLIGNDTYYLDNGDIATEAASAGIDTVISATAIDLSAWVNIENAIVTGAVNIMGNALANKLTGNSGTNSITGGVGNDTIDGGAETTDAIDSLVGGLGDDAYLLRNTTDVITEDSISGGGIDTVKTTVTGYTLTANVENLTLLGKVATGTGNSGNNTLVGNAVNNTLTGGDGNDTLNGGVGADKMIGGLGGDLYLVDNEGDVITEDAASTGGIDTIQTGVSYTFPVGVEYIFLTGSTALDVASAASNSTNTTITGNGAVNLLTGSNGNDNIIGNAGNDTLIGNLGNDTLNGGAGTDTMTGGEGNDTYIVDSSDTTKEVITESANAGNDTVQTYVTLSLPANVENITLLGSVTTGTGDDNANIIIGNTVANTLTGGNGNDTLDGGIGVDSMTGGAGNDTYVVDNILDKVIETANDTSNTLSSANLSINLSISTATTGVFATTSNGSIQKIILKGALALNATGNALANTITGNLGANSLVGNEGNDTIIGGAGADSLTGGTGLDKYVISATGETATPTATWTANANGSTISTRGMDIITVTNADNDTLNLSAIASTLTTVTSTNSTITAATAFAIAGTGTAVQTWLGSYSSSTNLFTSVASGSDTLLVYDNNGSTAGGVLEAIVLVGASSTLTVSAGVFTI